MTINVQTVDTVPVVAISGSIDGKTAPEAQAQILRLLNPKCRLILDMREVIYMSSAGLRVLLLLHRQCASQSSRLALVGVLPEVQDVMKITGFHKFFELCDTIEAAQTALAAKPSDGTAD